MSWGILNRLLSASTIWSTASLILMMDKEPVPQPAYASVEPGRDGGQVLRPDPLKVKSWLRQGATLVANDIDQLTPELAAFCGALERALGGKVQANLYLSSRRKQGFRVHFDTHDVFAVHVEGEKVWHVFEGCADAPIAHEMFKSLPQSHHDEAKGALWKEVRLTPGDLLYLPRGQYHYALAEDGGCIHIAFGVTYPIGMDVIGQLFQRMVAEPVCRRNLPQGDDAMLRARLKELGERAKTMLGSEETLSAVKALQAGFRYPRELYDLPDLLDPSALVYEVRSQNVQLVEQQGRMGLAKRGERRAVEVPKDATNMVRWVMERDQFTRAEIVEAFASAPPGGIEAFLDDMQRMGIVRLAS